MRLRIKKIVGSLSRPLWLDLSQRLFWIVLCSALLSSCSQSSQLSRLQQQGELLVGVSPPSGHQQLHHRPGFEQELIQNFAHTLGIKVRFIYIAHTDQLRMALKQGQLHLAVGLIATPSHQPELRFSHSYRTIHTQLIYRYGTKKPKSLAHLPANSLHIIDTAYYRNILQTATSEYPQLRWSTLTTANIHDLFQQINQGTIRYGLANTHTLGIGQQHYPYLTKAFTVGNPQKLAWAFPPHSDGSLRHAANQFLHTWQQNGRLPYLIERYFGHLDRFGFVDKQLFRRHIRERLPKYRTLFQAAAQRTGIDWRLLAAIGYQESHWQAHAVSPTGVRGIMMLTKTTAGQLGVQDRTDPKQSIFGGADYLHSLERRLPERISGDDRLWFAMASYNVGYGHLQDARILTEHQGGNPDLWVDVKQRLPLLRDKQYYRHLKYGYARGNEPVTYVDNIRYYYDLLTWYAQHPASLQSPD